MKRPVLIYHGGKFKLADWVISFFPRHNCYVEPFGGGASVLMKKERSKTEVYADLDGNLVNLFKVLRDKDKAKKLMQLLSLTPFSRQELIEAYDDCVDPVERARRLVVRSFLGHGSDSATRKTIPMLRSLRSNGYSPAREWVNYPKEITVFSKRLQGVILENISASKIIDQFDAPDTLIYADPPYVKSTRTKSIAKNSYRGYIHEMEEKDHIDLANQLKNCKAMVVISGYPSKLYTKLYGNWEIKKRKHITDKGGVRTECLWLNQACVQALFNVQLSLF